MPRKGVGLPKLNPVAPDPAPRPPVNLDDKCVMTFNNVQYEVRAEDLIKIKELGRGGYGVVETMRHPKSDTIIAVKVNKLRHALSQSFVIIGNTKLVFFNNFQRIHVSLNNEEQKRMLIELNASMQSGNCPYMVKFYGAMFREGDVWICMEEMDTSLDKFYRTCVDLELPIPEPVLGYIAYSVRIFFRQLEF